MGRRGLVLAVAACLVLVGCGDDGEDRPGQVTSEGGGTATGTGSASASGTGSASASASASGTGTGEHEMEAGPPAFSRGEADTAVDVIMRDFTFEGLPEKVEGPKVFFAVTNEGPAEHELVVVDADGHEMGEVHLEKAGDSGQLAVELEPGTYSIECHIETDGKEHTELGMRNVLVVE